MRQVIILGTAHSIQRGENSPEQFESLLLEQYTHHRFTAIAEEIENGAMSIAGKFCKEYNLGYLCVDPSYQERREKGIPTFNDIVFELQGQYGQSYPDIQMWPSSPNQNNLPREVWEEYIKRTESSFRAREAVWLERIRDIEDWLVLFICGGNHFVPFSSLLKSAGFSVVELCNDWEPTQK